MSPSELEWVTLQNNFEQYERCCLAVKLFAVAVFVVALLFSVSETLTLALLGVLWAQEAILRTFQARLVSRLIEVEALIRTGDGAPMQLNTLWQARRGGLAAMLLEYVAAAARPTVAFPHVALILIDLVLLAGVAGETALTI